MSCSLQCSLRKQCAAYVLLHLVSRRGFASTSATTSPLAPVFSYEEIWCIGHYSSHTMVTIRFSHTKQNVTFWMLMAGKTPSPLIVWNPPTWRLPKFHTLLHFPLTTPSTEFLHTNSSTLVYSFCATNLDKVVGLGVTHQCFNMRASTHSDDHHHFRKQLFNRLWICFQLPWCMQTFPKTFFCGNLPKTRQTSTLTQQ